MAFNHEVKLYPHRYVLWSNPYTRAWAGNVLWDAFAISIFLLTKKFKNLLINEVMKHFSFYKTVP